MSRPDTLDALLDAYRPPAPPQGLAERIANGALAVTQAPALSAGTMRPHRRDRRGAWLRRPMIAGGIALGLAFSGAVAATLAGVRVALPDKVQTVLADVPFLGRMAKAETPAPVPVERSRTEPSPAVTQLDTGPAPVEDDEWNRMRRARAVRHMLIARQIVAERRAAGLPTPRADRIERRLIAQGVLPADPIERAAVRDEARRIWRERMLARRAQRHAATAERSLEVPPPPVELDQGAGMPPGNGADETEALNRQELRRLRAERFRLRRERRLERIRRWREGRESSPATDLEPAAEEKEPPAR